MSKRLLVVAFVGVSALSAACRSTPAAGAVMSPADSVKASRTYNVITRDEMAEASLLGTTAYLAIQRLRPAYLIDKTAGAAATLHPLSVSVNGGQLVPVNALFSIPVQTVSQIRYLDTGNAAQQFHNRATGPVILISLTTQPSP
ncbi:MAG: hypothetical protein ABI969_08785 [bacterium]